MNIALEQTEEHVNGSTTNRYGDAFIRGNNGECYLTRFCDISLIFLRVSALHISCRTNIISHECTIRCIHAISHSHFMASS
jgi:hypothetical protein